MLCVHKEEERLFCSALKPWEPLGLYNKNLVNTDSFMVSFLNSCFIEEPVDTSSHKTFQKGHISFLLTQPLFQFP